MIIADVTNIPFSPPSLLPLSVDLSVSRLFPYVALPTYLFTVLYIRSYSVQLLPLTLSFSYFPLSPTRPVAFVAYPICDLSRALAVRRLTTWANAYSHNSLRRCQSSSIERRRSPCPAPFSAPLVHICHLRRLGSRPPSGTAPSVPGHLSPALVDYKLHCTLPLLLYSLVRFLFRPPLSVVLHTHPPCLYCMFCALSMCLSILYIV
ncbi:hypothetical protein FA13DRAFT_659274 [Coprinellus micaceus]|uniref:Uncharacterized protein n=1 Tax=Coprinellus micaceus TaxID=71717 RepID=A0A4Y7SBQ7_COPMI|nr:hypothetical protein FA13DRAFT_659274 [Coprinellus micaceus]